MSLEKPLEVVPHHEILRTIAEVARYMRVNERTIRRWSKRYGFPLVKLPNGVSVTSYWLIDSWLMARLKYQRANPRPYVRKPKLESNCASK